MLRLPRSTASHGKGRELGAVCLRQQEQESRLPRERDGRRCAGMTGRSRTSSACPRRGRCQPPLGRGLAQHNGRGGRRSGRRRRRLEETPTLPPGSGIGGSFLACLLWKCIEEGHRFCWFLGSPQWFCSMSFQPPFPSLTSIRVTGWTSHTVALWLPISP